MTLRDAILKTAALFEERPGMFDYDRILVPDCGTPGCAIGWIDHFSGAPARRCIWHRGPLREAGVEQGEFYRRMRRFDNGWSLNAARCAAALRCYADAHHPARGIPENNRGIPDSVRRIFTAEVEDAA
jgi:hypothetical protein